MKKTISIYSCDNEIKAIGITLNDEKHCTGHVTKRRQKRCFIFSDITKDGRLLDSIEDNVKEDIYQKITIEVECEIKNNIEMGHINVYPDEDELDFLLDQNLTFQY